MYQVPQEMDESLDESGMVSIWFFLIFGLTLTSLENQFETEGLICQEIEVLEVLPSRFFCGDFRGWKDESRVPIMALATLCLPWQLGLVIDFNLGICRVAPMRVDAELVQ